VPGDDALRFAERLLPLLDATRYSATYKLATLLALIDVAAEHTGPDGHAPETLSAKAVARRIIELYWLQTIPYGASGSPQWCFHSPRKMTFQQSWLPGGPHVSVLRHSSVMLSMVRTQITDQLLELALWAL
jgi:hypothetical protein